MKKQKNKTKHFFKLSVAEWEERFKPIPNFIDKNASWGDGDWTGIMYETFGTELDFVRSVNDQFVWTYVDGEKGGQFVINGYHLCNRIGYFICSVPANPIDQFEVKVD